MSEGDEGFGVQLRARRQSSGLSQEELAERSGLNVRTIRNLERGRARWPYRNTLQRLADALDLRDTARAEFMAAPGHRPSSMAAPGHRPSSGDGAAGAVAPWPGAGPVIPQPGAGPGVPRQLPAGIRHFTGRKAELDFLTALLDEPESPTDPALIGTVVISVVTGTAGAGKSALAVHWAHQHAGRFPGGQLYVDLHGFDPAGPPLDAATAMYRFLEAVGVSPDRIPADVDARAGLYRSVLAGRRMLIVLDNARDADQVWPLLPAAHGCMVLITSRSQLTDLIALEGATPLTVGLLSPQEARELLARRLGAGRVSGERAAVDELIGLCGHLPLALNIAAARAAAHPWLPLRALTTRLRGTHRRLDLLSAGTGRADVRAVFSWSYQALTTPAARMFRLLGVHPGPDISVAAAASLAALDPTQTRHVLEELTAVHLVTEHTPGRYTLHDLLRAHAAELRTAGGAGQERRAALRRVLDHYLHTSQAAAALSPTIATLLPPAPAAPAPGVTREDITSAAQAMTWFAAEHDVLAAAATAATDGFDTHAMQLPVLLRPYLCSRGSWRAIGATGLVALAAARRLGDLAGQGRAHCQLGSTYRSLGHYAEAESHLRQALTLFRQIDHPRGRAVAHTELGVLRHCQQRGTDALHHTGQALAQYRMAGDGPGEATGLNNLGWFHLVLGDPAKALHFLGKASALAGEAGDRLGLAYTLDSVGYAHHFLGEHKHAIDCYTDAEGLSGELGIQPLRAGILDHLGDAHHCAANARAARRAWHQALDLFSGIDDHDVTGLRVKLARSKTSKHMAVTNLGRMATVQNPNQ